VTTLRDRFGGIKGGVEVPVRSDERGRGNLTAGRGEDVVEEEEAGFIEGGAWSVRGRDVVESAGEGSIDMLLELAEFEMEREEEEAEGEVSVESTCDVPEPFTVLVGTG
jgi:hypothetical protein